MGPSEPTIVSVTHNQSVASYVNDLNPLRLDHVDGRMSDGSVERLYVAVLGESTIADDALLGLTARRARELAESHSTALE